MNQINNEYIKGGLINIIIVEKQKEKKTIKKNKMKNLIFNIN